jgi:toxin FitB
VAISVVSIAELHFGVQLARDDEEQSRRIQRLGLIESRFPEPLPVDDLVAREWGRLLAAAQRRGAKARHRHADLAIAATANVHGVPLATHNVKDFKSVADLVDVRLPPR